MCVCVCSQRAYVVGYVNVLFNFRASYLKTFFSSVSVFVHQGLLSESQLCLVFFFFGNILVRD